MSTDREERKQRKSGIDIVTQEGISNYEAIINVETMEESNIEEVMQTMGKYVTRSLRSHYTNKNIQLMMYIFSEGKRLETWLIDPWMVGNLGLASHREGNNSQQLNLRKVCKDYLSPVFVEDNKSPILLRHLTFAIFSRYTSSRKTVQRNNGKRKKRATQPVEAEGGGIGEEGFLNE